MPAAMVARHGQSHSRTFEYGGGGLCGTAREPSSGGSGMDARRHVVGFFGEVAAWLDRNAEQTNM